MRQEEFFKLLDRRLSVIEDGERRDILDEYRQHIAMKIQEDHISEEEALADFGDVDSFADEILSAYHVRTGEPTKAHVDTARIKGSVGGFWGRLRTFFGNCGRKISGFFSACRDRVRRLFRRGEKAPHREGQSLWKQFFGGICTAVKTLLRWCFNLLFGGLGLMFGVGTAFVLVMLGACIVVATQGYPLAGTIVLLLGLLLVNGALTVLFCRMIRKKEAELHA